MNRGAPPVACVASTGSGQQHKLLSSQLGTAFGATDCCVASSDLLWALGGLVSDILAHITGINMGLRVSEKLVVGSVRDEITKSVSAILTRLSGCLFLSPPACSPSFVAH